MNDRRFITQNTAGMGPEELAQYTSKILKAVLEATGLVEVVEIKVAVNQFHILGRVHPNHESDLVGGPIEAMLFAGHGYGTMHFGTTYFLKKIGTRLEMRYGWLFSVGSDDLPKLVERLCCGVEELFGGQEASMPEKITTVELDSAPMLGGNESPGLVAKSGGKKGVSAVKG